MAGMMVVEAGALRVVTSDTVPSTALIAITSVSNATGTPLWRSRSSIRLEIWPLPLAGWRQRSCCAGPPCDASLNPCLIALKE